jgi:hypothetical protein
MSRQALNQIKRTRPGIAAQPWLKWKTRLFNENGDNDG